MKKILFLFVIIGFMSSCGNAEKEEKYAKLVGDWVCSDWTIPGDSTNRCTDNISFTLNADKTYSSVLGSAKDSGTYEVESKIEGGRVIFSPEGKLDIPVEVIKLNDVYFEFRMNRSGQEEIMTLKKVK